MGKHITPKAVTRLTPLAVIEALVAQKPEHVALILGCHAKTPYLWRYASGSRDAGDLPSTRIQRALLAHSRRHGLGLTAEHLVCGASEDEIEAILAARSAAPSQGAAAQEAAE